MDRKLVERIYDPEHPSNWVAQTWNWGEDREADMLSRLNPGTDFVRIDTASEEEAEEAATRYWKADLTDSTSIDDWVEESAARKAG
ncbi:MAG: hypothetical protein M3Q49_03025 [Actinomycetota bacterium]|nr:hypothetical protein [Actinomycetota bacterium]MDP9484760.1 hypothetical protein [Actinomycetota bacterium]